MILRFAAILILVFNFGCASRGYLIDNQNYSLGELKRIIVGLIGEPRMISENQRTIYSKYFSRRVDNKFDPERAPERLYAKITILGDRRPYDVEVEVVLEVREGKSYTNDGVDEIETNKLGRDVRTRLNQSREDRNVIDDFRAF